MTNEDIVLSIGTLKEYTSGMIKRCQDAVTLSVDSMVNKNLEQAEKIMESEQDVIRYYLDYETFAFDACCEIIGELIDKDLENKNPNLPTITKMIEMFLPKYTESR